MKINSNTKISELIKHNRDSIEAIAALSKPLEKLRNPLLRKIMAPRVTIREAASMGNCSIDSFILPLQNLGFEYIQTTHSTQDHDPTPAWLESLTPDHIDYFDVRRLIEEGNDPLKLILKRFKKTADGHALCIISSFVPTPLIRLLNKDNVLTHTLSKGYNEYHSFFYKPYDGDQKLPPISIGQDTTGVTMINSEQLDTVLAHFESYQIKEIDVRNLEMPMPMHTILESLQALEQGHILYIHHKRLPVYLLQEISGRNFDIHISEIDEKNVKILISEKSG